MGGGGSARARMCKVRVSVCTWTHHSDTRARTSPLTCNDTHSPSHTYTNTFVHTTIMLTSCPHQDHTHIMSIPRVKVKVHREQTHIAIPPRARTHQNHTTSTLKHAHEHTRLRYRHRHKQKAEHRTQTPASAASGRRNKQQ